MIITATLAILSLGAQDLSIQDRPKLRVLVAEPVLIPDEGSHKLVPYEFKDQADFEQTAKKKSWVVKPLKGFTLAYSRQLYGIDDAYLRADFLKELNQKWTDQLPGFDAASLSPRSQKCLFGLLKPELGPTVAKAMASPRLRFGLCYWGFFTGQVDGKAVTYQSRSDFDVRFNEACKTPIAENDPKASWPSGDEPMDAARTTVLRFPSNIPKKEQLDWSKQANEYFAQEIALADQAFEVQALAIQLRMNKLDPLFSSEPSEGSPSFRDLTPERQHDILSWLRMARDKTKFPTMQDVENVLNRAVAKDFKRVIVLKIALSAGPFESNKVHPDGSVSSGGAYRVGLIFLKNPVRN